MKKEHKVIELKDFKGLKQKKDLEHQLKRVGRLRNLIDDLEETEIIDLIISAKVKISREFESLKKEMFEKYGIENETSSVEVAHRMNETIARKPHDGKSTEFVVESVEKIAEGYSEIINRLISILASRSPEK